MVRLRLSGYGADKSLLEKEIDRQVKKLLAIIPEYVYGFDDETLAFVVGRMLAEHSKTMAVAESCTGGNIAHYITSNPGSSAYFKGAVVAYSNDVKSQMLNVPREIIELHGAVSQQVAEAMAVGVRKALNADYSVANTGIAGPDGGTDEKPVGTVWIAVAGPSGLKSEKFIFKYNRERNIIRSTQTALNLLRTFISTDISASK
jgi:nicotinamide-nucleotide amidase